MVVKRTLFRREMSFYIYIYGPESSDWNQTDRLSWRLTFFPVSLSPFTISDGCMHRPHWILVGIYLELRFFVDLSSHPS